MNKLYFVVLLSLILISCNKESITKNPSIVAVATSPVNTVTVNIDQTQPGYNISPTFQGLSFETDLLVRNPDFLNENSEVVIQLIKNLGPGILRIGGNSSDLISWTGNVRTAKTPENSLTTSDVDRLAAFSRASGWRVLFGLNLVDNNMAKALDEAAYVSNSLGNNLHSLQAGNEPDAYKFGLRVSEYDYTSYNSEWDKYYNAIQNKLPQVPFTGPGAAYNTDWIRFFAENRSQNVKLLDGHYYNDGPASSPLITYHTILDKNIHLPHYLNFLNGLSNQYHLPYRITECNSIYGGGKHKVSDVFASALWALDMMWLVAKNNGEGVNFHGGDGLFYSPISTEKSTIAPRPVYYAMLAFKYGSKGGTMIPAMLNADDKINCSAYACVNNDNTYSVTLINKDETKKVSFDVTLTKEASFVEIALLKAPYVTSDDNISFAGATVKADGTFQPGNIEKHSVKNKSFLVDVPAGSAAIVTIK